MQKPDRFCRHRNSGTIKESTGYVDELIGHFIGGKVENGSEFPSWQETAEKWTGRSKIKRDLIVLHC